MATKDDEAVAGGPGRPRSNARSAKSPQQSLAVGAEQIAILSAQLDKQISAFENWVASIPGRVETSVVLKNPDGDESDLHVRLSRHGERWRLQSRWTGGGMANEPWAPLSSSAMHTKMTAVAALPQIVHGMVESQESLVTRLKNATAAMNDFATEWAIPVKEGE